MIMDSDVVVVDLDDEDVLDFLLGFLVRFRFRFLSDSFSDSRSHAFLDAFLDFLLGLFLDSVYGPALEIFRARRPPRKGITWTCNTRPRT